MTNVVWFRQDLRLADNPALVHALEAGAVVPIYILDDDSAGHWSMGAASRWWLHHSLQRLNDALRGRLQVFRGPAAAVLPALVAHWQVEGVYWNRCYEPWRIRRDRALKAELQAHCQVHSFNGSLLWEPWQVNKADGSAYRVFTPYYRKGCLQAEPPRLPLARPTRMRYADVDVRGVTLDTLNLLPSIGWDSQFPEHWQPGEEGAAKRLQHFLGGALHQYRRGRDLPAEALTSRLSPHLHFGELSPNQAWYAALHNSEGNGGAGRADDLDCFLSELGWREFAHYLLFHFPELPEKNFQAKFDGFPWAADDALVSAWQRGQTGFPIVDAGMRELWQTGYMHNRVRMIVASLLVKNLGQHWHHGQRWFWDCLLDADLANNSASWQWVAGSGADAAPYFRIFNPVTQGQKFDAAGVYVRRFCPELAALPDRYLHRPWEAPAEELARAGIVLGKTYPQPLVDLKISRQQALDSFATLA